MNSPVRGEKLSFFQEVLPHLMLLGAALFWGLNPILMKIGFQELPALPYNALRLGLGVIIALPVVFLTGSWNRILRADVPAFFVVSIPGFFVFQFFYSFGVDLSSASVSAIILGTLPIMVAIITRVFQIERLGRIKITGIFATFIGVILIATGKNSGFNLEETYLWGVIFMVISEVGYGTYTVFVRPLTRRYPTSQIVLILMGISFLLFAVIALPIYGIGIYGSLSPITWFSALFSGVFAMVIGNIFWSVGIRQLGSTNTSVYGNLPPVFGVIAGILILNESLSLIQIGGALVIMSGVYLVNRQKR